MTLIKIGLIGAQSSHARFFCEAFNRDQIHPGYSISYLYGADDPEAADALRREFGPELCDSEEDLICKSDAVAIVYRKGSAHFNPAVKALMARRPLFIDKPFMSSAIEAKAIAEAAEKNGTLLAGGSSLKALAGLAPAKAAAVPGSTVVVTFAADPQSEYDGYWFYGIHAVEVALAVCGTDWLSVSAMRNGSSVLACVAYESMSCVIATAPGMPDLKISVTSGADAQVFDVPMDYHHVCPIEFADMLDSRKAPRDCSFYPKSVELLRAIIEAAGL